jgi:hypothetical protein
MPLHDCSIQPSSVFPPVLFGTKPRHIGKCIQESWVIDTINLLCLLEAVVEQVLTGPEITSWLQKGCFSCRNKDGIAHAELQLFAMPVYHACLPCLFTMPVRNACFQCL